MICSKCNSEQPDVSKFCSNCGAILISNSEQEVESENIQPVEMNETPIIPPIESETIVPVEETTESEINNETIQESEDELVVEPVVTQETVVPVEITEPEALDSPIPPVHPQEPPIQPETPATPPQQAYIPTQEPKPVQVGNASATWSVVMGILGFCTLGCTGILGIILSLVAYNKVKVQNACGKGAATAGMIMSVLSLVLGIIVVIFSALLMPVFSEAKNKAQQSNCMSNMKQLGVAMMMYRQDYNERMPFQTLITEPVELEKDSKWSYPTKGDYIKTDNTISINTWTTKIHAYARNKSIFACPTTLKNNNNQTKYSYAYNGMFNRMYDEQTGRDINSMFLVPPVVDAQVDNVTNAIMITELAYAQNGSVLSPYLYQKQGDKFIYCLSVFGNGSGECDNARFTKISANHKNGNDMTGLFYDGHVEYINKDIKYNEPWTEASYPDLKEGLTVFDKYYNPIVNKNTLDYNNESTNPIDEQTPLDETQTTEETVPPTDETTTTPTQ